MATRKRFSYKKFEEDRNKATELSKSGFRLDTLSDDLHRTVEARKKVRENTRGISNDEYIILSEKVDSCKLKSACGWCTLHIVKRTKPECKICEDNT